MTTAEPAERSAANVKTALRVIEIMEIYAREGRSLTLTELARLLGAPMSSCLGLIRTLASLGYLYESGRRQGYYPTGRLLAIAERIAANDPLLERVQPVLESLRDETGETVIFGKLRDDGRVLYLAVFESRNPVRYTASAGEHRQAHTNSIGRALLAALPDSERDAVLANASFTPLTARTLPDRAALQEELAHSRQRGWARNFGESLADLGAIAMPVMLGGAMYGISVAGPLYRVEPREAQLAAPLRAAVRALQG
ncbi:IclR family transcriptional regulator [Cupriavidus sp. AU9028]|uniref:IclR family transcriptional regulator n=1 Tax=Cupriavidus sp. AU9028 TaxID=2871157 RepID=UPI001C94888E|nr:IclR family transcriptional regulator [Cupriavidus sp. AU9028]MBY4896957.1 IclR family transcriptional regulator [Cupriavidus sp. AU9028]